MIELRNLTIHAGEFSLNDVSLVIPSGQYAVLMGQTGQGKTTLLEAICGLRTVSSGQVIINQVDVTAWSPSDREIGYLPQDVALFPTMSVREQLAFALRLRKKSVRQIQQRVDELAEMLGITKLLDRNVTQLSGGEAQRVGLGRALSFKPTVMLLDEPLSALDDATRVEMHDLLTKVQRMTSVTTLHVTHNSQDADALANLRLRIENKVVVCL